MLLDDRSNVMLFWWWSCCLQGLSHKWQQHHFGEKEDYDQLCSVEDQRVSTASVQKQLLSHKLLWELWCSGCIIARQDWCLQHGPVVVLWTAVQRRQRHKEPGCGLLAVINPSASRAEEQSYSVQRSRCHCLHFPVCGELHACRWSYMVTGFWRAARKHVWIGCTHICKGSAYANTYTNTTP